MSKTDGTPKTSQDAERFGWWVCACVKRGRSGHMTHLKMHAPTVRKCRVCGATKYRSNQIDAELKARGE